MKRFCIRVGKGLYLRPTRQQLLDLRERINKALREAV